MTARVSVSYRGLMLENAERLKTMQATMEALLGQNREYAEMIVRLTNTNSMLGSTVRRLLGENDQLRMLLGRVTIERYSQIAAPTPAKILDIQN